MKPRFFLEREETAFVLLLCFLREEFLQEGNVSSGRVKMITS